MFTIEDVRAFWRTQPFEPFELRLSNGRVYVVDHPEFLMPSPDGRTVAVYTDDSRLVSIAVAHINTIEKINRPTAA